MPRLREKIRNRIPKIRALIKDEILSKHAGETVGDVTVKQVYCGMRGVIGLVCNSSYVDPYKGLHISILFLIFVYFLARNFYSDLILFYKGYLMTNYKLGF